MDASVGINNDVVLYGACCGLNVHATIITIIYIWAAINKVLLDQQSLPIDGLAIICQNVDRYLRSVHPVVADREIFGFICTNQIMIVGNGRVLALQFKTVNCHAINILCHRNKHGSVARPRREANLCFGNPITSCARLAGVRAEQSESLLVDVYPLFVGACRYNDRVASAGGINGGLDGGKAAVVGVLIHQPGDR